MRRTQQLMDLRSELSFSKPQAMVLGLERGLGPEDESDEFILEPAAEEDDGFDADPFAEYDSENLN